MSSGARVTFRATLNSCADKSVCVVGNRNELGNWEPEQAVRLAPAKDRPGVFEVSVRVRASSSQAQPAEPTQYKYLIRESSGALRWERGPNRDLSLPAGRASDGSLQVVVVCDDVRQDGASEIVCVVPETDVSRVKSNDSSASDAEVSEALDESWANDGESDGPAPNESTGDAVGVGRQGGTWEPCATPKERGVEYACVGTELGQENFRQRKLPGLSMQGGIGALEGTDADSRNGHWADAAVHLTVGDFTTVNADYPDNRGKGASGSTGATSDPCNGQPAEDEQSTSSAPNCDVAQVRSTNACIASKGQGVRTARRVLVTFSRPSSADANEPPVYLLDRLTKTIFGSK